LIPEKVFQNLSVISELLSPDIKGFSIDNLKEVISIVAYHVRKDDEDPPLKSEYLRRMVPHAEKYLNPLIDLQIVVRSLFYIPGQISYRYTFAPEYKSKCRAVPRQSKITTGN
jgi:hypothetical protein